ncbi:MAG: hypothetical protein AVDCRST_MAG93-7579 [uncultured Chloroflexia bacterium]|uniref:Uncharacterized protein n=1 Tax=uncultured Chloroflexia bacterium TaxID=1672391 RepID=A0A6J4MHG0_9CHLR|nr:MAG: hypothetical protein AVDCRST_MAG93-7579 [uncultured Chloroflexia bacterium]
MRVVASAKTAQAMAAGDERCIGYAVQRVFEPCQANKIIAEEQAFSVGGPHLSCIAVSWHRDDMVTFEAVFDDERLWFSGDLLKAVDAHRLVEPPYTDTAGSYIPAQLCSLLKSNMTALIRVSRYRLRSR